MERKYEIGRREAKRRLLWPVGALVLSATVGTLFGSAGSVVAERIWTLPDAIEFALESNPDSAIARERLLGAEAELEQAKAAYSPVVSVGSSYEATDGAGRAFGWIVNQRAYSPTMDFNRLGTIDNWNVHGMVSWTLYDGGRRSGMRDAAEASAEAARAGKRPRVDLYGRVDRDEGWQTGQSGDHWSAGVAVTYDLWDGGSASGDIRAASARRRSAIEVERKVRLAIEDEVARARLRSEEHT